MKSCLRLIAAQLHTQAAIGNTLSSNTQMESDTKNSSSSSYSSSSSVSSKRLARRDRRLHMLSCNDVISPPLWVLPLVHSPQYLSHLWELAEEARDVSVTQTYTHTHTHTLINKQTRTDIYIIICTYSHKHTSTQTQTVPLMLTTKHMYRDKPFSIEMPQKLF